jgi:hypothetical protein
MSALQRPWQAEHHLRSRAGAAGCSVHQFAEAATKLLV